MMVRVLSITLLIAGSAWAGPKKAGSSVAPAISSKSPSSDFCAQYEGKLVAFYSDVWIVSGCKRIPLSSDDVYHRTLKGERVVDIPAEVVRSLKESEMKVTEKSRGCSELNGHYISLDFDEIWFVESCNRRRFPDWMSFSQHRGGLEKEIPIMQVTWKEFKNIKEGKEFASVYDVKLEDNFKDVDVIPVNEACRGIEGKFVYFYSRIYKIEKCARRSLDPEMFTKNHPDLSPKELTAEQWISLPLGSPM